MSSSGLSSTLTTPPLSSDDERPPLPKTLKLKNGKLSFTTKGARRASPAPPREATPEPVRELSPSHEYVLADNPDIAFLVMFRSRFSDSFPKNVSNLGPQDIEQGIMDATPGQVIGDLLCALLSLVLNRKKNVERGHHGRALDEAVLSQRAQWPITWQGVNPLSGGATFESMNPTQRLTLLKALAMWSLNTSDIIGNVIREGYKQPRQAEDRNQPLAVQPWGNDTLKRRYWLIEGQHDAPFRLYRQSTTKNGGDTWWSVAGTIAELKDFGDRLHDEKSQAARRLADGINAAIPRLLDAEDKKKRKEYRQQRKAAFTRPEPRFSLYEGRTRGKRQRYTYSDEESDDTGRDAVRGSTRLPNRSTPAENASTIITASGRQVKSRYGRSYGESVLPAELSTRDSAKNWMVDDENEMANDVIHARSRRATRGIESGRLQTQGTGNAYGSEEDEEEEEEEEEEAESSGGEWEGDDADVAGKFDEQDNDEDDAMSESDSVDSLIHGSRASRQLIVTLKCNRLKQFAEPQVREHHSPALDESYRDGIMTLDLPLGHIQSQTGGFPINEPPKDLLPLPGQAGSSIKKHDLDSPPHLHSRPMSTLSSAESIASLANRSCGDEAQQPTKAMSHGTSIFSSEAYNPYTKMPADCPNSADITKDSKQTVKEKPWHSYATNAVG